MIPQNNFAQHFDPDASGTVTITVERIFKSDYSGNIGREVTDEVFPPSEGKSGTDLIANQEVRFGGYVRDDIPYRVP